jgi:hypothetical protein
MRELLWSILALALLFPYPRPAFAFPSDKEFVRTANYFLRSGPTLDQSIDELAKFDLIVIPVEAQVYNESFFSEIRSINNDIVILAYVATVSWNDLYWDDPLHQYLYGNARPQPQHRLE